MMNYKVIWFDDDCAKPQLEHILDMARSSGIELVGFPSARAGNEELERNIEEYDAAVLDGLFYETDTQAGDSMDEGALASAYTKLSQLRHRKDLPVFVLSGRTSFTHEENPVIRAFRIDRVYDKLNDDDFDALWAQIKERADKSPETQIRFQYQCVFEVCTKNYIGVEAGQHLLDILLGLHGKKTKQPGDEDFNQLRKCLEWMFRAANRIGLLHDKCIKEEGKVNLRASSLFMAGNEVYVLGVGCSRKHFPALVTEEVKFILDITNAFSHTEDPEKQASTLRIAQYRESVTSPYLLYSLTFQLMDVLLWYKAYADENQDVAANKALWIDTASEGELGEPFTGTVLNKNPKGFAFIKPDGEGPNAHIPPSLVAQYGLVNGTRATVRTRSAERGPVVTHIAILKGQNE